MLGQPLHGGDFGYRIVFDLVIVIGDVTAESCLMLAATGRHGNIITVIVFSIRDAVIFTDAFKICSLVGITAVAGREINRQSGGFAGLRHIDERLGNPGVDDLPVAVITGADIRVIAGHIEVNKICWGIVYRVERMVSVDEHVLPIIDINIGRGGQAEGCCIQFSLGRSRSGFGRWFCCRFGSGGNRNRFRDNGRSWCCGRKCDNLSCFIGD